MSVNTCIVNTFQLTFVAYSPVVPDVEHSENVEVVNNGDNDEEARAQHMPQSSAGGGESDGEGAQATDGGGDRDAANETVVGLHD